MQRFSERERILLLIMREWNDAERSYNATRDLFNATFRNEGNVISKSIIKKQRFEESGTIKDRPKKIQRQRQIQKIEKNH